MPDSGRHDARESGAQPRDADGGRPRLYQLGSNQSSTSVFEDVEMAHDELYAGPMAESLPSSVAAFSHRRVRADSSTSFAYYTDDDEERDRRERLSQMGDHSRSRSRSRSHIRADDEDDDQESVILDNGLIVGSYQHSHRGYYEERPAGEDREGREQEEQEELAQEDEEETEGTEESSADARNIEENEYVLHRHSSAHSRISVHSHLLQRGNGTAAAEDRRERPSSEYDRRRAGAGAGAPEGRVSQKAYLVNEDMYVVIAGFRSSQAGLAAYWALCVLSLGLCWLVFRWMPRWYVRLVGRPSALRRCSWVVVENQWNQMAMLAVDSQPYGRALSTVFGSTAEGRKKRWLTGAPEDEADQVLPVADGVVDGAVDDEAYDEEEDDPPLRQLRVLDYRYVRFFFHPQQDAFVVSSGWKDPGWRAVRQLQNGIDSDEKNVRERVFGSNLIDIAEKSTLQLLVDEVFHPFYVFQIASLVLWSLDEYYYYAIAIFLMSFGSIATTLIETKATMRRLRDISRFECDVRVLRNGFWRTLASGDLVPGDVYELSDPGLTLLPADSLLLSGDCIVNESMLTGESVPVSKTPATDSALRTLDLAAPTMLPESARHFLFCGTRIIRARRPHGSRDTDFTGNGVGTGLGAGIGAGSGGQDAAGGDDANQPGDDVDTVALAMVLRTGFNTTKGALVRSMLFPKPSGFKFYRDSFRYIGVMAGIAVLGFIASFINFIRLGLAWHLIVVRALDLITIVVPPALPATLTIGTNFALSRLRSRQIFCISPQRVNVGGKLDLMCFDKTGTLTEDGLDVLGVRVVDRETRQFAELVTDAADLVPARQPPLNGEAGARSPAPQTLTSDETRRAALFTMATCHSLRSVDDELMGDPLDLKMFAFTGWTFEEGHGGGGGAGGDDGPRESLDAEPHNDEDVGNGSHQPGGLAPSVARPPAAFVYDLDTRPAGRSSRGKAGRSSSSSLPSSPFELGIVRSFEFVSHLRRASVIVRVFGQKSGGDVYVKGAPECMREICRPQSLPDDYDELLASYTHKGYRVIGCATKHVPRLSWLRAQKMGRHEAEADLDFVGFIVFENKLKPTTTAVLDELLSAGIGAVMVTGDNILTAISVARECGLISKTAHCFVPRFVQGHAQDRHARLQWESIDNNIYQLDEKTLLPLPAPPNGDASLPYAISDLRNFSLAVSGDVFRWMVDFAPAEVLQRMLVAGKIYARMSPDEKHELVEKLQSIDYCCGFCGDGANDCGALKAADVGISLSEAEASVAAPFTSRVFDIRCVPEVIREGRAALVTSFSCFKYMSLYSAIQFTSVSFLYASGSNLGDFQFLYIDLVLILPIAVFMSWAGPFRELGRKRPTADLVSRKVLTPLLGLMAISVVIQTVAYVVVRRQPWFIPPVVHHDETNIENSENTALFLVSSFEYIFSGIVLNAGPPFRQDMWRNWPFVLTIAIALLITGDMTLAPFRWLRKLMQLTAISSSFKALVIGLGVAYLVTAKISEAWILPALARLIGRAKLAATGRPKKRREYKVILEQMRM